MKTETISLELQRTMRLIPGYDPFVTAPSGCWFDEEAAREAIAFFPERLRHVEGSVAGQPFLLEPWQQSIIGNLHGWKRRDKQGRTVRRYRECLLMVARKNGKSPFVAGIALEELYCIPERGQQNYLAASSKEQAGLVLFRQCRGMIEQNDDLLSRCKIFGGAAPAGQSQSITRESTGSFLKIVAADSTVGKHGKNPNLVIVDEVHEFPNRDLIDTFRTAMVSANKPQPLMLYVTTSDYDRESICNEIYDYACKVRDGVIDDPAFLPVIYEAKPEDDWTKPETWAKANPNLNISVSEDDLARACEQAKENPRKENEFKRLHLDIRTQNDVRWIPLDQWDSSDGDDDEADYDGLSCWCGLDLSTTTDIAAFARVFRKKVGKGYAAFVRFWVPEENARQREKRDRVPYLQWIRQGWITATPGNSIDYDRIRVDINELRERCDIKEIAADRWNATQLIHQLDEDGHMIFAFGQGYKDMSPAAKELERAIMASEISFGRNPVMRWMGGNVAIETDAAGNIKPSKKKSTERIDGIVAVTMGVGRASLGEDSGSVYETRGLLSV